MKLNITGRKLDARGRGCDIGWRGLGIVFFYIFFWVYGSS